MGYRCPVCADPQADDVHLANHLAFTALARGGDHEHWLDDHVPDWGGMDEATLAARVREHAESAEYPTVFEDTTPPEQHSHDHASPTGDGVDGAEYPETAELPSDGMTEETRAVIEQARELTRRRRERATDDDPDTTSEDDT